MLFSQVYLHFMVRCDIMAYMNDSLFLNQLDNFTAANTIFQDGALFIHFIYDWAIITECGHKCEMERNITVHLLRFFPFTLRERLQSGDFMDS